MATKITICDCCSTPNVKCGDVKLFENGRNDTVTNWYCFFCLDTGLYGIESEARVTSLALGYVVAKALGKIFNKLDRLEQRLTGKQD